jgi:hypothetical protein
VEGGVVTYVRMIEDAKGDLIDIEQYCSATCWRDAGFDDPNDARWPCPERTDYAQHCPACGEVAVEAIEVESDIRVEDPGSVALLRPLTSAGSEWLRSYVAAEPRQHDGGAVRASRATSVGLWREPSRTDWRLSEMTTYSIKRTDEFGPVFVCRIEAESEQEALLRYLEDVLLQGARFTESYWGGTPLDGTAIFNGTSRYIAQGATFEAVPVPNR